MSLSLLLHSLLLVYRLIQLFWCPCALADVDLDQPHQFGVTGAMCEDVKLPPFHFAIISIAFAALGIQLPYNRLIQLFWCPCALADVYLDQPHQFGVTGAMCEDVKLPPFHFAIISIAFAALGIQLPYNRLIQLFWCPCALADVYLDQPHQFGVTAILLVCWCG